MTIEPSATVDRRRRWSVADESELLAMKARGDTEPVIAAYFGTSVTAVSNKYSKLREGAQKSAMMPTSRTSNLRTEAKLEENPLHPRSRTKWTAEENADLVRRVAKGDDLELIAADLGRTRWACRAQHMSLQPGLPQRANKRARNERVAALRAAASAQYAIDVPISLTAEFCKDPAPGRSALDKKRLGLPDPPEPPDWRRHQARPTITLPTRPFCLAEDERSATP